MKIKEPRRVLFYMVFIIFLLLGIFFQGGLAAVFVPCVHCGWDFRVNSQGTSPSFASSSQGWREISLYIFMCMLSMWIRLRFYILRICVYVYKIFLNSRSLAGPLLNFFVNTGFWGWTQVNFLTRRYLSARIFFGRHSLCLVLPTFGGSGLL